MRKAKSLRVCLVAAMLFAVSEVLSPERCSISAQEKVAPTVSDETYERVLDLLFPRDVLKDDRVRFAFVIRYKPSFEGETQISIAERAGRVEVIEYASADGNIGRKLNEIIRRMGREDPQAMARQIKMRQRLVNLEPATTKRITDRYFDTLRSSLEDEKQRISQDRDNVTVFADGTEYRLWYRGIGNIEYTFDGSNINSPTRPDEFALVEWIKDVYRLSKRQPASSGH